jgi:hypothetical protein
MQTSETKATMKDWAGVSDVMLKADDGMESWIPQRMTEKFGEKMRAMQVVTTMYCESWRKLFRLERDLLWVLWRIEWQRFEIVSAFLCNAGKIEACRKKARMWTFFERFIDRSIEKRNFRRFAIASLCVQDFLGEIIDHETSSGVSFFLEPSP